MLNNSLAILQTQQQTLAPQQQFALKLLQMSAAELLAETALAAEDNPFIEREDSHLEPENEITETKLFEEQADSIDFPERFGESAAAPAEARPLERIYSLWPGSGNGAFDDASPAEKVAEKESLREYLLAELGGLKLNEKKRRLVACLIEELDDRGFLVTPLEEVAASYRVIEDAPVEAWADALRCLQSFDPPGIGASSAVEALTIETIRASNEALVSKAAADLLCDLLNNDLAALAKHDFKRMRAAFKRTGIPEDSSILEEALTLLRRLDPHPAANFSNDTPQYIVADLIVTRCNSIENHSHVWRVYLNPDAMPSVKLAPSASLAPLPDNSPLARYLSEAKNLVAALEARRATLIASARFAVEHQQRFFDDGPGALAPLTIQETAAALGLAESTVSRAVSGKFLQTPYGTIELRSLFTRAVLKSGEASGESVSQHNIRTRIVEIIRNESPEKPLSDQAITNRLQSEGCDITRRTVAKYRDLEGIPPARLRAHGNQAL